MDIYAQRRMRLAFLVEQKTQGNIAEFARLYGYSRSQISQFLSDTYNGGRSIGERAARTIDERVGNPPGWLDQELNEAEKQWLNHPFSTAELRVATNQTQPIDDSPRGGYLLRVPIVYEVVASSAGVAASLDLTKLEPVKFLEFYSTDYHQAIRINGWGLRPRVKNGEFIVINQSLEPRPGDDVLLSLRDERVFIVQFFFERGEELAFGSIGDMAPLITFNKAEIESSNVIVSVVHSGAEIFEEEA